MTIKGVRHLTTALLFGLAIAFIALTPSEAPASEIKYVVNGVPVTSYDIARRSAFLKLQRRKGNVRDIATQEMIDQVLRTVEIKRLRIRISDAAVQQSYANFAQGNKLTTKQMDQILGQSGVTKRHFLEFIRTQMGWSRALGARFRADGGGVSEQDVVQRMLQQGGKKPSATEYMLQQVIFVIPKAERKANLNRRKKEAQAMRNRFNSCNTTREFAKGLIDVTVRDLGRVLEPELPPDWAEPIKETQAGAATTIRVTDRGVEFIGICSAREVSDDRVAQMVFQTEGASNEKAEELSDKYMAELKEKARIIER